MSAQNSFRAPVELLLPEPNASLSCVTAQAFYMFGIGNKPNVAAIDQIVGRYRGECASHAQIHYLLLREKVRVYTIGRWDRQLFLRHGIEYSRKFHSEDWDENFERYLTPARIRRMQTEYTFLRQKYRGVEDHLALLKPRKPDFRDIREALSARKLVIASVYVGEGSRFFTRQVLLYGKARGGYFRVYHPNTVEPTLIARSASYLDGSIAYNHGINILSL
jgi:hypothetical protein